MLTLCGQHYVMSTMKVAYCTSVILNLFDLSVQDDIPQFTSKSLMWHSHLATVLAKQLKHFQSCQGSSYLLDENEI